MQWWERGALWTFILLVCAGIGAFVASRSNLFPPEVRVGPSPSAESPSPTPEPETRWRITLTSRTDHRYHVGGACTSDWRVGGRPPLAGGGVLSGGRGPPPLPGGGRALPS